MKKAAHIPKEYHSITPSLAFQNTPEAIEWYKNVFNASEKMRMNGPDNKVMHAELTIGDSILFLGDANPKHNCVTPFDTKGNSIHLYLYVEDVDAVIKKASQNGASVVMEPMDMFYGDRCGSINDPYGYTWMLATHVKDVTEKEMRKQVEEMPVA
ncbi:MAG TPA: VOC family protein [Chitinophagaceae bacterium]